MSDRIGEDALLDVGCCLNRFELDSLQCLSWKSHTYLANKGHVLPVRLLDRAQINSSNTFVCAQKPHGSLNFSGTQREAFELGLAAIKDSDLRYITLFDPTGEPISDEELAQIAAVAPSVKVRDLRLYGQLTHLSPAALHRLMYGFSSVKELTLHRFNGTQLTDEHLHECGRRQIWRLFITTRAADAGLLAFGDEALFDFLYAPEHGMSKRNVAHTAFNTSPQFVQKLISFSIHNPYRLYYAAYFRRAHLAASVHRIDVEVKHLPLRSQQLNSPQLTENRGISEHSEQLESGARITLKFGRKAMSPRRSRRFGRSRDEEESDDKFRFILWK